MAPNLARKTSRCDSRRQKAIPPESIATKRVHTGRDIAAARVAISEPMSLTLDQRTNLDGIPKAAELIEITGAHALEASDRAIMNLLYQHAHDSGRLGEPGACWELPITALRPPGTMALTASATACPGSSPSRSRSLTARPRRVATAC